MLKIEDRGPVRWLVLDRPERRNAIPADGWDALREALEAFEASDARVLVITGAGGHFCAGADLGGADPATVAELASAAGRIRRMQMVGRAATALRNLSKPAVAAVDGFAVGAGANLALGCDVVFATPEARFSEIFVMRGLTVDFGGTWLLPRVVGLQRAKDLALSGRIVEGEEAHRIGLAAYLVPRDDLEEEVQAYAERLALAAPLAVAYAKRGLERSFDMTFEQALAYEDQAQALLLGTADLAEGVQAFFERRDPRFQGH